MRTYVGTVFTIVAFHFNVPRISLTIRYGKGDEQNKEEKDNLSHRGCGRGIVYRVNDDRSDGNRVRFIDSFC